MREYLCECEECLCLNFLSWFKNTSKIIKNKNKGTEDSEDYLLDQENDRTKIFEMAVTPCNTSILFLYKNN